MNTPPENDLDPAPEDAPHSSEGSRVGSPAHASNSDPAQPWNPDSSPLLVPIAVSESPLVLEENPQRKDEVQTALGLATEPDTPLFQSFSDPEFHPPSRIPHLGHLAILVVFAIFGLVCASLLIRSALHFHLFGVTSLQDAVNDIHYTLGSEVILYLLMFGTSLLFFPLIWRKSLFAGMQWNGIVALQLHRKLFFIAAVCCGFALTNGLLFPGPTDAPIDKLFRTPGAAWFLFAFGVTFAPFFEEMVFRGFLLPALCTAFDWIREKMTHAPMLPLDETGQPRWSFGAAITGSILTSLPFAAIHAAQTGYSWGPFVLLVGVSLVLCWARLGTRSLAASVFVHATYNFLLFSLMMLGTGGFRHLDRM